MLALAVTDLSQRTPILEQSLLLDSWQCLIKGSMFRIFFYTSKSNVSYHLLSEVKDSSPIRNFTKGKELQERIHVERVMGRLKVFRLLENILPLTMIDLCDQIWIIAGAIVNMQPPLIK
jgi:hypothetical protein